MNQGDLITRAYSILTSLKNNIPDAYEIQQKWPLQFNDEVNRLEKALQVDLSEFKVPESELHRSVVSYNTLSDETNYREGLWIERSSLMHKLESLLTYFSILNSPEEGKIGFKGPEN
tara:strand:- start:325 stop:675 length:351 start_codon:yes stop_codon:yes gene_type:complete